MAYTTDLKSVAERLAGSNPAIRTRKEITMVNLNDNRPKLGTTRRESIQDARISVCTDCKWGIFPGHEYHWTSRGLVHNKCDDARLVDAAKAIT